MPDSTARSRTGRGAETRRRIREAAMALFRERRPADVTVGEIASSAGVYPNQITHHFGSKDALYVDAAFALLLRDTERLQAAGRRASTPDALRRALARTALSMPSTTAVVGALALARGNESVQPVLQNALAVLFRQSDRYLSKELAKHGWTTDQGVERATKTFWSAVFGAVLISQAGYPGGPSDIDVAATLVIRDEDPAV